VILLSLVVVLSGRLEEVEINVVDSVLLSVDEYSVD
jgi:hypothetical protein